MSVTRWVLLSIAALLIALLARMPAAWVAERAAPSLRGVQLQNIEGTVWRGRADVTLTQAGLTLKDIRWRFQPAGLLALQWRYGIESSDAALAGRANVGLGIGSVTLTDGELALLARTAGALVPMLAAFSPEGNVTANIRTLQCKGERCSGDVKATWNGAALSLAELRPLGDYQIDAVLNDGRADFDVKTLKGTLRAAGKGQFANGALRFTGELSAPPDQMPRVQGLMRLLGTPDERGVLRINR